MSRINSRRQRIYNALFNQLMPDILQIEDESSRHNVPKDTESHFKVVVVSKHFESLSRIQRHRFIQKLLADEFNLGLHALSLQLFTPAEWAHKAGTVLASPPCRGGGKNQ